MSVNSVSGAATFWFKTVEKDPSEALNGLVDAAASGKTDPANPAAANTSFPTRSPISLDTASILSLQQADAEPASEGKPGGVSATEEFLAYMKKTPEERLRENILKSMGLTEDDLEGMPPEERKAVEDKIKEIIKEKITPVGGSGLHVAEPRADAVQMRPGFLQLVEAGLIKVRPSAANPAADLT